MLCDRLHLKLPTLARKPLGINFVLVLGSSNSMLPCSCFASSLPQSVFICYGLPVSSWVQKYGPWRKEAVRFLILIPKGCGSKNASCTKYCIFSRSLNIYGENKGCLQKALTNLILKMSLIILLAFM